jgi:hypothetical protein
VSVVTRVLRGEQKANISGILPSWAASARHQYGNDMQARFAANVRPRFRLLIEEASGSASAAQVWA